MDCVYVCLCCGYFVRVVCYCGAVGLIVLYIRCNAVYRCVDLFVKVNLLCVVVWVELFVCIFVCYLVCLFVDIVGVCLRVTFCGLFDCLFVVCWVTCFLIWWCFDCWFDYACIIMLLSVLWFISFVELICVCLVRFVICVFFVWGDCWFDDCLCCLLLGCCVMLFGCFFWGV